MSKSLPVGSWPLGVDNVHEENDAVFQQGRRQATQRLLAADNVDLRDDGWPLLRRGTVEQLALLGGQSIYSAFGLLLAQFSTEIHLIDTTQPTWTSAAVVTGLDPDEYVHFCAAGESIFWMTPTRTGRILKDGTPAPWGLPSPAVPIVTLTSGTMCPGQYTIAAAYLDAFGVEHALSGITRANGTGFTVDLQHIDPRAAKIRLYASQANGPELYFVADVDPAGFPVSFTSGGSTPWSDVTPIGLFMDPPVPGHGVFDYRGFLITTLDNMLFASFGQAHHLFQLGEAVEARPTTIFGGVGLRDGFWTTTAHGAYWTSGPTPQEWDTIQRDARRYARGGIRVPGKFLPAAETTEDIALFVSDVGVVAGLPNGDVRPITQDRFHFDVTDKRATFMLHYRPQRAGDTERGIRQLLFTLN